MYGLYDKEGILRYLNSDKDACIAYAELFDLCSSSYSLMSLNAKDDDFENINHTLNNILLYLQDASTEKNGKMFF